MSTKKNGTYQTVYRNLINEQTGEAVVLSEDVFIPENAQRRMPFKVGKRFAYIDPQVMSRLELTAAQSKVVMRLLLHANIELGLCFAPTKMLAQDMGVAGSNVSRTLKQLSDRRIIRREAPGAYVVSPWVAFFGEYAEWHKTARTWLPPIWDNNPVIQEETNG
jgi:hypothetical protein